MSKIYTKDRIEELANLSVEQKDAVAAYGTDMHTRGFLTGYFGVLGSAVAIFGIFEMTKKVVGFIYDEKLKRDFSQK